MKTLRLNIGDIANRVAPRPKGVWAIGHIGPEVKQESHNLTLIHGGKYGVVGKGFYTIRKQGNQTNNSPLPAA